MAARNLCRSDPAAFASEANAGAALPLLPTLVVAAVVGALALCREPTPPTQEPVAAVMASHETVEPIVIGPYQVGLDGSSRPATVGQLSGSLAFARHFPVIVETPVERVAPTRVARAAHPRAGCTGARCVETTGALAAAPHRPAEPARGATQAAYPLELEREAGLLPDLAIPFAPTVRAVKQVVGFVGHQATTARTDALALCDTVADLVGGLR